MVGYDIFDDKINPFSRAAVAKRNKAPPETFKKIIKSFILLQNMSDRFVAPPSSNILIQDFVPRTMNELLAGLSNLMFAIDTENLKDCIVRVNRARRHYRELNCARARCCYGLLCCHFPSCGDLGFKIRDKILS